MALSFPSASTISASTTVTMPAHQVGDLLVIWAMAFTSAPTVPTAGGTVPTWTTIDAPAAIGTIYGVAVYAVATATNHTSGTFTNASRMVACVIRGQATIPIGGHAAGTFGQTVAGPATGQAIAPGITMSRTDGTSFLLYFYALRFAATLNAAPSGFTRQQGVTAGASTGIVFNTKDVTTSDGASSQDVVGQGTSQVSYIGQTTEILATINNSGRFFDMF
ncbi:MAG: hypothetical protein JWO07_666 [Candidatus Saccharibacteria bacterium]|nr:hypothetical protein [Candidatus Saccharibacteria bacterium]